jgi:hypothetical protein
MIRHVAGSLSVQVAACALFAACSADPGQGEQAGSPNGPAGIDFSASAPAGGQLSQSATMSGVTGTEYSELAGDKMLAKASLSDTHTVTFWQDASGRVSVIESLNVDKDTGGPKLQGFRASRDSYLDAYTAIAGADADPAAVARLRDADQLRIRSRLVREADTRAALHSDLPVQLVAKEQSSLLSTDGLVFKGVQEDWAWWQTICTQRNRSFSGEDQSLCYGATLTPAAGLWTVTQPVDDFEESNIALFNADGATNAILTTQGIDCGFLELGACTGLKVKSITVPPRFWKGLYNTSDDGFYTGATGKAMGLHYVFWF